MNKNEFKLLTELKIVILDGACGSNLQREECIPVYVLKSGWLIIKI